MLTVQISNARQNWVTSHNDGDLCSLSGLVTNVMCITD